MNYQIFSIPFIVDSPAGSIDLAKRKKISEVLPEIFEQLIFFVMSSEREQFATYFIENYDNVDCITYYIENDMIHKSRDVEVFMKLHSEDN